MKTVTILFDLDGTLIDSTPAIVESFDFAFKSFGENTPEHHKITELIGYPLDTIFEKLGVDRDKVGEYVEAYRISYFKIHNQKTKLIKDAKEAVILAYEFANLGVVTTKTASSSKKLLEYFDILNYFDTVIGREDVLFPKPDPEPIFKAINSLKVETPNIWMIGDTILDAQAALSANINIATVLCGYGKRADLEKYTNNIFETPLKAVNYIKNLCI
jgi:phosphoglycolate phosphatase